MEESREERRKVVGRSESVGETVWMERAADGARKRFF